MDHLYGSPALTRDAFLYSPVFAQAVWPLTRLPWPAFGLLWSVVEAGLFYWLLRPLSRRWAVPAMIAVLPEVMTGNVYALMAAALVVGVCSGLPWVFLGLTKVVPGAIGLAWLTMTWQWKELIKGFVITLVVTALSFLLAPQQWRDWAVFLVHGLEPTEHAFGSPLLTVGLPLAAVGSTVIAAITKRPWLLAVAALMASPTFGLNTLTLLAAAPRLRRSTTPGPRGG